MWGSNSRPLDQEPVGRALLIFLFFQFFCPDLPGVSVSILSRKHPVLLHIPFIAEITALLTPDLWAFFSLGSSRVLRFNTILTLLT